MSLHRRGKTLLVLTALSTAALALTGPPAVAGPADVRINEVESNGGSPGDWVELVNTGTTAVDVSGWVIRDNDNSHTFTIASGTTLVAGAHRAFDVDPVFGLGSADAARLFRPGVSTAVDSYTWTSHASTTYGRCADGTGAFTTTTAPTKGAANSCPAPAATPWPGGSTVANADTANAFGTNLSGLSHQSATVVWAVKNGPSTLYRLTPNGSTWQPSATKTLNYANGSGDPDTEAVVYTPEGLFAATERDNDNDGTSLLKVLRYDPTSTATTLNATAEWNLTADLPPVAANSGLEAIGWIPDTFLTANAFRDQRTGSTYAPSTYPNHGAGLFFVGLEANGVVYAYALSTSGTYTRVATIPTGLAGVMDLEFEASTGHLWAACDNTCQGRTATLDITAGTFTATHTYARPSGLPDYNNEGFAISPSCTDNRKQVLWADDENDAGHALRSGTLTC